MSRAAKSIVAFLFILMVVALGLLVFTLFQKQELEKNKLTLEQQIEEFQSREKKYILESRDLKAKIEAAEQAKAELENKLSSVDAGVGELNKQIETLTKEKDKWQSQLAALKKERDELAAKAKAPAEPQIVYKYIEKEPEAAPAAEAAEEKSTADLTEAPKTDDETYWAQVIKAKTSLELDVADLQARLTKSQVQVEELKKLNSDLDMELGQLKNEKEGIERKIKQGSDLADSLSLALARAENDKKFLNGRLVKVSDENIALREQIKQLGSTKIALEKSIVRLQDEKKNIERKLDETENVIQNRIDEIWKIKEGLQDSFQSSKASSSSQVTLPPIVVSQAGMTDEAQQFGYAPPGFNGNIVSINDENNFVIINIGEDGGLKLGDNMSVYRGAEYVASLEIIQVRKDIAAADIKNKVDNIRVGDIVR